MICATCDDWLVKLPRAILIDLDDTILDDSGCVESCWIDACSEAAKVIPNLDVNTIRRSVRTRAEAWWSNADRHQRGRLDLRAATTEILTGVLAELGHDPVFAAGIANRYRDLREERATLFDGAIETLEWLQESGVRLGLMTNGAADAQRTKIERFALARHFGHIIIEGEFGVGKPHRSVYETLLRELSVSAGETWAIGDNLQWDVYAPMDMGIHGIWIDPSEKGVPVDWREPDRVVRAFSELRRDQVT
jgi:putative hydrolase of the HAD superfamily